MMQMPSGSASARLSKFPERCDQSEQWNQPAERTWLSPEACLFIPGHAEHGCNGAARARSEQGQSSRGSMVQCLERCWLVSRYWCSTPSVGTGSSWVCRIVLTESWCSSFYMALRMVQHWVQPRVFQIKTHSDVGMVLCRSQKHESCGPSIRSAPLWHHPLPALSAVQ